MKKILIISDAFHPTNVIGAIRPTKIAKKLLENGYKVDVYTRYNTDPANLCTNLYAFESLQSNQQPTKTKRIKIKGLNRLKILYNTILHIRKSRSMYIKFKKWLEDKENNKYDIVFSTYMPISSIWCGMYYKKKNPQVKWICDFRDPMVTVFTPLLLFPYINYLQNKACRLADIVTTVSNGYFQRIVGNKYNKKSYMIPNGYDVDDIKITQNKAIDNFTITYAGVLYGGKRDLSPLLKAISQLIDEGIIDENKISINYAGSDFEVLKLQSEKYNIAHIIHNQGLLPRDKCLQLQQSSHFLILSTWNEKNETGVFPGKFLEYMLIKAPIISIVDGNVGNSEVTSVINEGSLGVSYEAINDQQDFPKLKNYIKKQYLNFITGKPIDFSPNNDVLQRYNYNTIIKQIIDIIEK